MPTLCDMLSVKCPDGVEGHSLVPHLSGKGEPRWPNASFSEFMGGQLAARSSRYKIIYRGMRTTLFDLEEDPKETADMSDEKPVALRAMRDVLGMHLGLFVPSSVNNSAKVKDGAAVHRGSPHKREDAKIDAQMRKQLEALGYMGD